MEPPEMERGPLYEVAVGASFTLLLFANRKAYAVGNNVYGQLGRGHSNAGGPDNRVPRPVTGFGLERITLVAAGHRHCAAVTENGKLFLWGYSAFGQCGTNMGVGRVLAATRSDSGAFTDADVRVVFVACGTFHTTALTSDGGVVAFGRNFHGQLGTGNNGTHDAFHFRGAAPGVASGDAGRGLGTDGHDSPLEPDDTPAQLSQSGVPPDAQN